MKTRALIRLLRVNHWFKNVVVFGGTLAALLYRIQTSFGFSFLASISLSFILVCLVSSANYVINQIVDAKFDKKHPEKKNRPIPSREITLSQAWSTTIILFVSSYLFSFIFLPLGFSIMLIALGVAGFLYNIPPIRLKDKPYIDVISESANNPIRFLLGWYLIMPLSLFPPVTIILLIWAAGAVLMTGKRYDELVHLGKKIVYYRHTFKFYTPSILAALIYFYSFLVIILYAVYTWQHFPKLFPTTILITIFLYWITKSIISGRAKARDIEKFVKSKNFLLFVCLIIVIVLLLI